RRNGHLGYVQEEFDAMVFGHRGGVHRGFKVRGRNGHSEVEAFTSLEASSDVVQVGEISSHDFGAEPNESFDSFVQASHHSSDGDVSFAQHRDDFEADRAHLTCCGSGHEDRITIYRHHSSPLISPVTAYAPSLPIIATPRRTRRDRAACFRTVKNVFGYV